MPLSRFGTLPLGASPKLLPRLRQQKAPVLRAALLHDGVLQAPQAGVRLLQPDGAPGYVLAEPHAQGNFGRVSYACDGPGTPLLAKEVFTERGHGFRATPRSTVLHEAQVAQQVPTALPVLDVVQTPASVVQIMPLMDGDMLHAAHRLHMRRYTHGQRDTLVLEAFVQGSAGLCGFHAMQPPFVHGDVKLANFLWSEQHGMRFGDYGVARPVDAQTGSAHGSYGTGFTLPPEALGADSAYGVAGDMWAFGVCLGELAVGPQHSPFQRGRVGGQTPQERILAACARVCVDGRLQPERLRHGADATDMDVFLHTWHGISADTCRFAVERLFLRDAQARATSREAHTLACACLAQRPEHAARWQAVVHDLFKGGPHRERTMQRLREQSGRLRGDNG